MERKKKKGFTLIEMMAVIAILGIFSTLIFSLFSSSTSMLVMAENDNVLQNESRIIIDILEEDIRYGKNIKIENPTISGGISTESILILERKEKIRKYQVENGAFNQYISEKKTETETDNNPVRYELNATPSKYIKKFKVEKQGTGKEVLYKIEIEFENGKSNYKYSNSIYPMNGIQ